MAQSTQTFSWLENPGWAEPSWSSVWRIPNFLRNNEPYSLHSPGRTWVFWCKSWSKISGKSDNRFAAPGKFLAKLCTSRFHACNAFMNMHFRNATLSYFTTVSVDMLRVYCIDTEALVFMFNAGSSYGFTIHPIFTRVCMLWSSISMP